MNTINAKLNPSIQNIQTDDVDPKLLDAARGMEANFIHMLLKNMRKTVQESDETKNNHGLQIFRGMLDEQYANIGANTGGIGLADLIVRQLLEMSGKAVEADVSPRPLNETDIIK